MTEVVTTPNRPGPGPKPSGPTHPTPTSPPPRPTKFDHQPIGGHAEHQLPTLAELIRDAEGQLSQAIATLGRQYDPASAPFHDPRYPFPADVDMRLGGVVADVWSALDRLASLASLLPSLSTTFVGPARTSSIDLPQREDQRQAAPVVPAGREGLESGTAGGRETEARRGPEGGRGASAGRPQEGPQVTTGSTSGVGRSPGSAADRAGVASESVGGATPAAATSPGTRPGSNGPGAGRDPDPPCRCLMCAPQRGTWAGD